MPDIALPRATQRVNALLLRPVTYNRMRLEVIAGNVPATFRDGRWFIDERDIDQAAQYLSAKASTRGQVTA